MKHYSRKQRKQHEKKKKAWSWTQPVFYITAALKNFYEFVLSFFE